jgi:hypothetical protein
MGARLSVYLGMVRLGDLVEESPRKVAAYQQLGNGRRKALGVFRDRQAAMRALRVPPVAEARACQG